MSDETLSAFSFRWRSWLGLTVVLYLLYGAANAFLSIYPPLLLHIEGFRGTGFLVVPTADSALLGQTLADLEKADPRLGAFLLAMMDAMCAFMMAYAILHIGVTWFALRRGQRWALWVLLLGALTIPPYYIAVSQVYAGYGAPFSPLDWAFFIVPYAIAPFIFTILGWLGLREIKFFVLSGVTS
ncbi:MAG: hypothetical protein HYX86_01680 [Chloroflexi bacterium]|nr:hypothetical protein [Chloroflexota bacterium]